MIAMHRYATRSSTTVNAGVVPHPHPQLNPASSVVYLDDHHASILAKNRTTLLSLEQLGVLAPGVLTIDKAGELVADLSSTGEPNSGTTAGSGFFPTPTAADKTDSQQVPSWLRDYLVRELDVHGHGPPAACAALYDHLKRSQSQNRSQDDVVGINNNNNPSVRTVATLLRCASMSVRYAVQVVRDFVDAGWVVEDTYELEVGLVVRTVERLVTCCDGSSSSTPFRSGSGDENKKEKGEGKGKRGKKLLPRDIQLVLDIGSMGVAMKGAMEAPLRSLVVEPYSALVEKLDMVVDGLRREEEHERETEGEKAENGSGSDSGVDGC